jgi:hypothetical protein
MRKAKENAILHSAGTFVIAGPSAAATMTFRTLCSG